MALLTRFFVFYYSARVQNKKKIINDPVYGFVNIPYELVFDLIEHPYFQRLRRIKQLGLSHYVYPGALHTRFQHVIGAMSLTYQAVESLRFKGIDITHEEAESVCAAVLLHDLGHGPFSHTLEHLLVEGVAHEHISRLLMEDLNHAFNGRLSTTLQIFNNTYPKKFLHQLVSSQLDMDRLDYLRRDSFYTGVQEGVIGHDRIIKMLTVIDDELAVEEKGIYSIEKFIIARRLMYWQVYLHKTVIAAESLLINIVKRARELAQRGEELFCSPSLHYFLYRNINATILAGSPEALQHFINLDDFDIFGSIKVWAAHPDPVLSRLSTQLVNRELPKVDIGQQAFPPAYISELRSKVSTEMGISENEAGYFVFTDTVQNKAYSIEGIHINIVGKDGKVIDITQASDNYNISALSNTIVKHYLCFPKNL